MKFTTQFLTAEASRNDLTDFGIFTFIALISAWAIVTMIEAIVQTIGRY
jgi:hypothetical protein